MVIIELNKYLLNKVESEVFSDTRGIQQPQLENWRYADRAYIFRIKKKADNIKNWSFGKDPLAKDIKDLIKDISRSIILGFKRNRSSQKKVSVAGKALANKLKQALSSKLAGTNRILIFKWKGLIDYGLDNAATADFYLARPRQNVLHLANEAQKYAEQAHLMLKEKKVNSEQFEKLSIQQKNDLEEFRRFSYRKSKDETYDDWLKFYLADTKAIALQLNTELTKQEKLHKAKKIFFILRSIRPKYLDLYPVRDLSPHLNWLCNNYSELGGNICGTNITQS